MSQTKTCQKCTGTFEITELDIDFYNRLSPVIGKKKIPIPHPRLCPRCRFIRRASHRNEQFFYARTCSATKERIISIYSEEAPFPVYSLKYWWKSEWNPLDYGRDFEFTRPFFDQFKELRDEVPRPALLNKSSENSDYTNHASDNKNCYLSSVVFNSEDVYYSRKVFNAKSVVDATSIFTASELLYECYWGEKLYNCKYANFCYNSSDLTFCYDCRSCQNCFMSSNLRNKSYIFKNQQLTKETYEIRMKEIYIGRYQNLTTYLEEFEELRRKAIKPALRIEYCENTTGDYLIHCKDCTECYTCVNGENCRYCVEFDSAGNQPPSKDCMDSLGFGGSELIYEVHAQSNGYRNQCTSMSYDVTESTYLDACSNVSNCFGCVGLHNREKYCIFNKQYMQEDYEELVPRIIEHMEKTGEWCEFFPSSISIFGYNKTVAYDEYPLTKDEAVAQGFNWDDEISVKKVSNMIDASEIPDDIRDVTDDILTTPIECSVSGKPFKIIKEELKFYRDNNLPIPRMCPEVRHRKRKALENPKKLWSHTCAKCEASIQTSFPPDRPDQIYCEKCYLEAVY